MWIAIICFVVYIINFMIVSKWMELDRDDPADIGFCCFFSFIGSVIVIPIFVLVPIFKKLGTHVIMPTFQGLFWLRDFIVDGLENHVENVKNYVESSAEERKTNREKRKLEKEAEKELKIEAIIIKQKQTIKKLNARIVELNKYSREDMIEV